MVGAGIVGLAAARALTQRHPGIRVVVLEKEPDVGLHQTGHNSGVVHRGLYYRPGSLKAVLCVEGARRMVEYCAERGIPCLPVGKIVVATSEAEVPALQELFRRGTANGVPGLCLLDASEIREIEPHAAGLAGLHSPATSVVDFGLVARAYREDVRAAGGEVLTGTAVLDGRIDGRQVTVTTMRGTFQVAALINCAGLHADRVARLFGAETDVHIVPFRGEYYTLRPELASLVRGLIYPTPDPAFPFLGVHVTRGVDGSVHVGPNAVPALAREGYGWGAVVPRDVVETVRFAGFRRLARQHWQTGFFEIYRSLRKRAFVNSVHRLLPIVRPEDLMRAGAGVRAQAVTADGHLADDFVIVRHGPTIHVINAPSPAATASLAIGERIADMVTPPATG